jgi:serine O-acetyltransferase
LNLLELVSRQPTFRNLLYFRLGKGGPQAGIVLALARPLYPSDGLLFLDGSCTIGGGLYIQHGFSTIVNGGLGDRCWINQQVMIGFEDASGRPRLGHNVCVAAGAKVLGPIVVGDNVAIGANAVVVKSVPADCTVVGVPAYIVRACPRSTLVQSRESKTAQHPVFGLELGRVLSGSLPPPKPRPVSANGVNKMG